MACPSIFCASPPLPTLLSAVAGRSVRIWRALFEGYWHHFCHSGMPSPFSKVALMVGIFFTLLPSCWSFSTRQFIDAPPMAMMICCRRLREVYIVGKALFYRRMPILSLVFWLVWCSMLSHASRHRQFPPALRSYEYSKKLNIDDAPSEGCGRCSSSMACLPASIWYWWRALYALYLTLRHFHIFPARHVWWVYRYFERASIALVWY